MVKIIIVYLALILMFSSCYGWMAGKDDVFINNRNDNFLNQIKLNGYYYSRYNQNYFKLYFFYQNGVVFTPSVVEGTLKDAEKYIKDTTLRKVVDLKHPIRHIDLTNIDDSKQYKDNWGIYKITNDKIIYEFWVDNGENRAAVFIRKGEILDNKTIVLYGNMYQGKMNDNVDTLRFRQCDCKPDSTNNFIK